jgi:hypothetical protein
MLTVARDDSGLIEFGRRSQWLVNEDCGRE